MARVLPSIVLSAVVLSGRKPPTLDVLLVQDMTASYASHMLDLGGEAEKISVERASRTHVGLVVFQDKPWSMLGKKGNTCYKELVKFTSVMDQVADAYYDIKPWGGVDLPEASLEAVLDGMRSKTLGWSTDPKAVKVVILITDATPHDTDDYVLYNGQYNPDFALGKPSPPPRDMPVYPTSFAALGSLTSQDLCVNYQYPSAEFVAAYAKANGFEFVVILPVDVDARVAKRWDDILVNVFKVEEKAVHRANMFTGPKGRIHRSKDALAAGGPRVHEIINAILSKA